MQYISNSDIPILAPLTYLSSISELHYTNACQSLQDFMKTGWEISQNRLIDNTNPTRYRCEDFVFPNQIIMTGGHRVDAELVFPRSSKLYVDIDNIN